jgi:hypothetical protein
MPPNTNLIMDKNINLQTMLNKQLGKNNIRVNQNSQRKTNNIASSKDKKNPKTTQN